MSDALSKGWTEFAGVVGASRRRLLAELSELNAEVVEITAKLENACSAPMERDWEPGRSASVRTLFELDARSLLSRPLERYSRTRIHHRIPRAFEDFRTSLTDAVRKLPVRAEVTPRILLETLPPGAPLPFFFRGFGWQDRPRSVEVRLAVRRRLELETSAQARLEGCVYLSFAQATLNLLDPWQTVRARALIRLHGESVSPEDGLTAHSDWKRQGETHQLKFTQLLQELERALVGMEQRMVGAILGPDRLRRVPKTYSRRRTRRESYWGRQQRSVRALVETERSLVRLGREGDCDRRRRHSSLPPAERSGDHGAGWGYSGSRGLAFRG